MARPKRIRISSLGAIALLIAATAATPLAFVPIAQASEAIVQASGLDFLLSRSPGERDDSQLSPVKGKGAAVSDSTQVDPTQRALGKIFDTPPAPQIADPEVKPFETALSELPIVPLGDLSHFDVEQPSNDGLASNAPGVGGIPSFFVPDPTGGGPGGGGNGTNGDPAPPLNGAVTSAVPEPATWMLFMLGIGFVGAAIRRNRHLSFSS